MNVGTMRFRSRALGKDVTYSVVLPEVGAPPYGVLLLLHGYGGDHTAWLVHSGLARHAEPHPLIIVLPDGGTSAYLNLAVMPDPTSSLGLQRYEDFLMDDLRGHVEATFRARPGRWAIGGLSMGGYGAMRLGCKYPERFASVWAHSGAYYSREELAGHYPDPDDADVYAHAARLAGAARRPEIAFDCGLEDRLLPHSRRLHAHLEALGVPHRYAEHPGGHSWDYWDEHAREALAAHARALAAEAT